MFAQGQTPNDFPEEEILTEHSTTETWEKFTVSGYRIRGRSCDRWQVMTGFHKGIWVAMDEFYTR